mmetsp:Transcript_23844/g.69844  ORF Transcript_23844/g.69844 Transcript_23844/m.69844 type:complete len:445 (-) Transcript_23844:325-1659(-)
MPRASPVLLKLSGALSTLCGWVGVDGALGCDPGVILVQPLAAFSVVVPGVPCPLGLGVTPLYHAIEAPVVQRANNFDPVGIVHSSFPGPVPFFPGTTVQDWTIHGVEAADELTLRIAPLHSGEKYLLTPAMSPPSAPLPFVSAAVAALERSVSMKVAILERALVDAPTSTFVAESHGAGVVHTKCVAKGLLSLARLVPTVVFARKTPSRSFAHHGSAVRHVISPLALVLVPIHPHADAKPVSFSICVRELHIVALCTFHRHILSVEVPAVCVGIPAPAKKVTLMELSFVLLPVSQLEETSSVHLAALPGADVLVPVRVLHDAFSVWLAVRKIAFVAVVVGKHACALSMLLALIVCPLVPSSAVGKDITALPLEPSCEELPLVLVAIGVGNRGLAAKMAPLPLPLHDISSAGLHLARTVVHSPFKVSLVHISISKKIEALTRLLA